MFEKNSALQLKYVSGGTLTRIEVLSTVVSSTGIHLKQFPGNLFYVRWGEDFRNIEYKHIYSTKIGQFSGTSTAISLVVGNQWQFDTFTIGCDWLGAAQPMESNVNSTTYSSNAPLSTMNQVESDKTYFLKKNSDGWPFLYWLEFLNIFKGVSRLH